MIQSNKTTVEIIERVRKFEDVELNSKRYNKIKEIIMDDLPCVRSVAKHYSDNQVIAAMVLTIGSAMKKYFSIDVSTDISEAVAEELIHDDIGRRLSVQDVGFAIKEAAKTQKVYNRIDFNVIFSWLKEHAHQKASAYEQIVRENQSVKNRGHKDWSPEIAKKLNIDFTEDREKKLTIEKRKQAKRAQMSEQFRKFKKLYPEIEISEDDYINDKMGKVNWSQE